MNSSYWTCALCHRQIPHGADRYNCTVCKDHDECETCAKYLQIKHPHRLVRELAYGSPEINVRTGPSMAESLHAVMNMYSDRHCLGIRNTDSYTWLKYKKVYKRVQNFANGLRTLVESRESIGICAANRPEWIIADLACLLSSFISVPIYNKMSDRDMTFVINNTKISTIICDKETLPKFIELCSQCSSLHRIICMDSLSQVNQTDNIRFYEMQDIEKKGSSGNFHLIPTKPSDCLTIINTSGSTDVPKGAILSDQAFRAIFPDPLPNIRESILLHYQPLAWYGGRNSMLYQFFFGGRIAFSSGNIDQLMEEIALVRPTIFGAPPNIWNKIYSEFKGALALKLAETKPEQHAQIEEDLLRKFSKLIPNRCIEISIVGALISPIVHEFMQRCFRHCRVVDAYGITECGGIAFGQILDPRIAYRLENVPEMGFTVNDKPYPRGELLTKTPQLFSGYVNNSKETQAALTADGFFRTGDIVELRQVPNRPPQIRIIDRKKNFFKLSHGQFVSPEYLEGIFTQSPLIDQIYIHADLQDDCILAVVVPNREHAQINESDPKLHEMITNELQRVAKSASLQKHEIPSRILIDFERFTIENGLLTSSMKPCRPRLAEHYKNSIEQRLKKLIDNEFVISGGNSLQALRLSKLIEKDLGLNISADVFLDPNMNFKRLADFAMRSDSIVSRLLADADVDLKLTVGKPKDMNCQPSIIFITGVTGFVGGFLIKELLRKHPKTTKFLCLVRCESSQDPLDRIKKNLVFLGLWKEEFRERIVPVRGDLSQPQFGLTNEEFLKFSNQTDLIFHCGAVVNFVLPYSQLYGPNVIGTREILRFATSTSCIPIQYISTISVLPAGIRDEISIDQIPPHRLTNGYGQSKWVAEKLVAKAIRSGLPIAIYRLGSMCADTHTGACNPLDIYTLFVKDILKVRCYPLEIIDHKLDTLPINFATKNIVYLSQNHLKSYGQVYHIVHSDGGIRFETIVRSEFQLHGIPMKQWRNSSSEFLIDIVLNQHKHSLSSKQFYSAIPQQELPSMNSKYATKWLNFIAQNLIKTP